MPRRVIGPLSAAEVKKHALDTPEGRDKFVATRFEDAAQWSHGFVEHAAGLFLILDHVDALKAIGGLRSAKHAGMAFYSHAVATFVKCDEPGCKEEALYGTMRCIDHFG